MSNHPRKRKAALPVIARTLCTGCGWCVAACPDHLLVLEVDDRHRKAAELPKPELCTGCGKCLPACNFRAIRMVRRVYDAQSSSVVLVPSTSKAISPSS